MTISNKIVPLFDAVVYLSKRFCPNRISQSIKRMITGHPDMQINSLTCCERYILLESELDKKFEQDNTMLYYFTPLKTVHPNNSAAISLGSLLLSNISTIPSLDSYDDIIDYYSLEKQDEIFNRYRDNSLEPFIPTPGEGCNNLQEFIQIINSIFEKPEDKWAIIDVVSNPVFHLEKLKSLVCAIADYISDASNLFINDIEELISSFNSKHDLRDILSSLNIDLGSVTLERITFHPSIMMFNGMSITVLGPDQVRIFSGIYMNHVVGSRNNQLQIDSFVPMLKALSDGTRLKALKEMLDKYSFGQELAEKLGGSRNAMYYHLEKMVSIGLIDCKVTEYRMLYTMNKRNVYDKLTALRDFLVDGWKPEDEDRKA